LEHQNWKKKILEKVETFFLKMRQFENKNPPKFKDYLKCRFSEQQLKAKINYWKGVAKHLKRPCNLQFMHLNPAS